MKPMNKAQIFLIKGHAFLLKHMHWFQTVIVSHAGCQCCSLRWKYWPSNMCSGEGANATSCWKSGTETVCSMFGVKHQPIYRVWFLQWSMALANRVKGSTPVGATHAKNACTQDTARHLQQNASTKWCTLQYVVITVKVQPLYPVWHVIPFYRRLQ